MSCWTACLPSSKEQVAINAGWSQAIRISGMFAGKRGWRPNNLHERTHDPAGETLAQASELINLFIDQVPSLTMLPKDVNTTR